MKKNLYYRSTFQRGNMFKMFFLSLFQAFNSAGRLLLEVFTRKNFGERYFLLSPALGLTLLLALIPVIIVKFLSKPLLPAEGYDFSMMETSQQAAQAVTPSLMPDYLTWYIFLVCYVGISIKHHLDMRHNPSVFDFEHFSLSSGEINPLFFKIKVPFMQTTVRTVECFFEPAVFFILGAVLWLVGQKLGILLVVTSIAYSFNYMNDYMHGDNFIMDKIDEMIANEEMEDAFVNELDESETRGFRIRGKRPKDEDMRRKLLAPMVGEEEILVVE